jgi:hypothetical protein
MIVPRGEVSRSASGLPFLYLPFSSLAFIHEFTHDLRQECRRSVPQVECQPQPSSGLSAFYVVGSMKLPLRFHDSSPASPSYSNMPFRLKTPIILGD